MIIKTVTWVSIGVLIAIVIWVFIALDISRRNYAGVVAEMRANVDRQENNRTRQFSTIESHLYAQDEDMKRRSNEHNDIVNAINNLRQEMKRSYRVP